MYATTVIINAMLHVSHRTKVNYTIVSMIFVFNCLVGVCNHIVRPCRADCFQGFLIAAGANVAMTDRFGFGWVRSFSDESACH